ncbi:unnamed protein product [Camellia sinensis]
MARLLNEEEVGAKAMEILLLGEVKDMIDGCSYIRESNHERQLNQGQVTLPSHVVEFLVFIEFVNLIIN